jgi:guanylate kinase
MSHWDEFDYVIINENLATATDELAEIVAGRGSDSSSSSERVQTAAKTILGE